MGGFWVFLGSGVWLWCVCRCVRSTNEEANDKGFGGLYLVSHLTTVQKKSILCLLVAFCPTGAGLEETLRRRVSEGEEVMRGLDEWEVHLSENFPAPTPVLYSRVMCRGCEGRTVEVEPKTVVMGTDHRRGPGVPWTRVTSLRFLCDDCGVVTCRRNH